MELASLSFCSLRCFSCNSISFLMFSFINLSTLAFLSAFSCGDWEQRGLVILISIAEPRWSVELDSMGLFGSKIVGMSRADFTAPYLFTLVAEPSRFGDWERILSADVDYK